MDNNLTIVLNQYNANIVITVESINNIYYLETIPIYLDTLIRLTQDKNSTRIPLIDIDHLCSIKEKKDVHFNEQKVVQKTLLEIEDDSGSESEVEDYSKFEKL